MQQIFDAYVNYLTAERHVSDYTVRNYTADLAEFCRFLSEQKVASLDAVDRHTLRSYMAQLLARGIVKASIARKLSSVRSFYRFMLREGFIKVNPAAAAASPKLDRRLPSFLTIAETEAIIKTPDVSTDLGKRDRCLLELIYAAGLRVSELVGLDLENVHLESRELRVWGKGSKERIVLIGEPAARSLDTYLIKVRPRLTDDKKMKAVFLNYDGTRLSVRWVQKMLRGCARTAGIEKRVYPHLLRHTFATHMLDGGADLRVVQELLGHANLSTTQIYTHVTRSQARKVYLAAHPMARQTDDVVDNSR